MGFGSYDESEQDQGGNDDEVEGQDVTSDFKSESHNGSDSVENEDTSDMMKHL